LGASAPGASTLVTGPVTDVITPLHLASAVAFSGTLLEATERNTGVVPGTGPIVLDGPPRMVRYSVQTISIRRCENRLRWLEQARPWPKHGVHCETDRGESGDDDNGDD
jgi:hypothetical protein